MVGKTVCYMHGGKSLSGVASPQFVHGRYSKYLPERLRERYEESTGDAEILALRGEIALLDARLVDLLKRVDTGESGAIWKGLSEAFRAFKKARATHDAEAEQQALDGLQDAIDQGHSDYLAWSELTAVIEQRRKLVDSERKRLSEMQQMITAEQAMTLLTVVVDTVKRHVHDRDALKAISDDIGRAMAGRGAATH